MTERCTWCGEEVEAYDGFRAYERAGERKATFCRLEHVIPWEIQGPHWETGTAPRVAKPNAPKPGGSAGEAEQPPDDVVADAACAHCGAELTDTRLLLVRHRGEYRIADGFCSADHLASWAKAGGRFA